MTTCVWTYKNNHLYHDYDALSFNELKAAEAFYFRYLDPASENGLTTENSSSARITGYQYNYATGQNEPVVQRAHWNTTNISYNEGSHTLSNGSALLGVTVDGDGVLRISGNASGTAVAEVYFASASSVKPPQQMQDAVDHIDISIVGSSAIEVPLAYGNYYDKDGNFLFSVSKDNNKTAEATSSVDITMDDLKRATITAWQIDKQDGDKVKPLDNAFYITGYSKNENTDFSTDQVRIEGSFRTANAMHGENLNAVDPVTNTYKNRLDNRVYYTITVTKRLTFTMKDGTNDLYDADGNLMTISADVTTAASFSYWDERNECPPLQAYLPWYGGTQMDNAAGHAAWLRGGYPSWGDITGMDFVLGGDANDARSQIVAIEITKYVVDESGSRIQLSSDTDINNTFMIWGNPSADSNDVIGLDVNGYDTPVDYTGYSELHSKTLSVGEEGLGLVYDYDVTPGMYYIQEVPSTIPEMISDVDGNIYTYASTRIETEYVWRNDKYSGRHYSETYTGEDSDSYNSIPEVLGAYTGLLDPSDEEQDVAAYNSGTWNHNGETGAYRNGFLEFYVYNVYTPSSTTRLAVEKHWEPADQVPENAEVTIDLLFRARKIGSIENDGAVLLPEENYGSWSEYALVSEEQGEGKLFDSSLRTTLTLKAGSNSGSVWKGQFSSLPKTITDAEGTIYEVDYTAEETEVLIPGEGKTIIDEDAVDISDQYEAAVIKEEPAESDAEHDDGTVTITNKKGGLIFQKKWLRANGLVAYTPESSDAVVTAQLRRSRTVEGSETTTEEAPVSVTVMAHVGSEQYRQMIKVEDLAPGKSLRFSIGNSYTSWFSIDGAAVEPESAKANLTSVNGQTVTYTGGNAGTKNGNANIYTISNVTQDTTIYATLTSGSTANLGYWIDQTYERPGTTTVITEPHTEDEAVTISGKVTDGVITLNQDNNWTFALSAEEMEAGWTYYINTEEGDGRELITETGVSADAYTFTAGPVVSKDANGNTVYTSTNTDKSAVSDPTPIDVDVEEQPSHHKTLTENYVVDDDGNKKWDGTYTLSLDVTGKAVSAQAASSDKVDIILVLDMSSSMRDTTTNGKTRYAAEIEAIDSLGYNLLGLNTEADPDNVRLSLMTFGNHASEPQTVQAADYSTFKTALNTIEMPPEGIITEGGQGTNWEAALQKANTIPTRNDVTTMVIFISDGVPTLRDTPDNPHSFEQFYYRNVQAYGPGTDVAEGIFASNQELFDTLVQKCYDNAKDDARAIVSSGKELFTVSVFETVNRMETLAAYAYSESDSGIYPEGHYKIANNADDLSDFFEILYQTASKAVDFRNVKISDPLTVATKTTASITGTPVDFRYYKVTVDDNGNETAEEWIGGPQAAYNGSGTGGTVDWDISAQKDSEGNDLANPLTDGKLENDVTYRLSFTVWPNQEAYDAVLKLNEANGDQDKIQAILAAYPDVADNIVKDPETGEIRIYSNGDATLKYTQYTSEDGGEPTPGEEQTLHYPRPAMETLRYFMKVAKIWNDSIYPDNRLEKVKFEIYEDYVENGENEPYQTIILDRSSQSASDPSRWEAVIPISPGIQSDAVAAGKKLNAGHVYTVKEYLWIDRTWKAGTADYHYEFDPEKIIPVLLNGDMTYEGDDDHDEALSGVNDVRGSVTITKIILDEDGNELTEALPDDEFTFTITLKSPGENGAEIKDKTSADADAIWYRKLGADGNQIGAAAVINSGDSFTLQAGQSMQLINVPIGVKYAVREETSSMPARYGFDSILYTFRTGADGTVQEQTGDAASLYTVSANTWHYVTVKNKMTDNVGFSFGKVWLAMNANPNDIKADDLKDWEAGSTIRIAIRRIEQGSERPDNNFILNYEIGSGDGPFQPVNSGMSEADKGKYQLTKTTDGKITTFSMPAVLEPENANHKQYTYYAEELSPSGTAMYNIYYGGEDGGSVARIQGAERADDGDVIINQENTGYQLPSTGGPGTRLFTLLGGVLVLGAGAFLWRRRRWI